MRIYLPAPTRSRRQHSQRIGYLHQTKGAGLEIPLEAVADYGLLGLVILGLAQFIREQSRCIREIQEKRVDEARESVAAHNRNAAALEALSQLIKSNPPEER